MVFLSVVSLAAASIVRFGYFGFTGELDRVTITITQ